MSLLDQAELQVVLNKSWDDQAHYTLRAMHPVHGKLGYLEILEHYDEGELDPEEPLEVVILNTTPGFRRLGVASWLMRHLEARYPGHIIAHGNRTPEGRAWAESFYGAEDETCAFTLNGSPC